MVLIKRTLPYIHIMEAYRSYHPSNAVGGKVPLEEGVLRLVAGLTEPGSLEAEPRPMAEPLVASLQRCLQEFTNAARGKQL